MSDTRIIIFTRFPVPGQTKTRLIPALGAEGAAQFQHKMTEHTLRQALKSGFPVEIRYTGGTELQMRDWLGDDLDYADQGSGDLGERMGRAFQEHFKAGAWRVVIIGSDCPANHWLNIREAFRLLDGSDCVIGPAKDGGYYLLGMKEFHSEFFSDIEWGSGEVLAQSMRAVGHLRISQMPLLGDIDRPEDLPARISVIIPTLNEEGCLATTLGRIEDGFNVESIVVDGGSSDRTCGIAGDGADRLLCWPKPGRAFQMNAGASVADGEILLFLHADSLLPVGYAELIRNAIRSDVIAGAFSFRTDYAKLFMRLIEWGTNLRAQKLQMPYGDQGLFMNRDIFFKTGPFPEMPIMEDFELVRRLRRQGRIVTLPQAATSSARRWRRLGLLRTTLRNQIMIAAYLFGFSPEKLRRFYSV